MRNMSAGWVTEDPESLGEEFGSDVPVFTKKSSLGEAPISCEMLR